jgi:hypothetical protein
MARMATTSTVDMREACHTMQGMLGNREKGILLARLHMLVIKRGDMTILLTENL